MSYNYLGENSSIFCDMKFHTNTNKETNTNTNIQSPSTSLNSSEKSLDSKKKIAITFGVAAAIAATAGIIYGVKTGKFSKAKGAVDNIKDKVISSEKTYSVEIPQSCKYDMSKEADKIGVQSNNTITGFARHIFGLDGEISPEKLSDKERSLIEKLQANGASAVGDYGVMDGRAYVKYAISEHRRLSSTPGYTDGRKLFSNFVILSPDDKFTPAQLNLITLMEQGQFLSPNAPDFMTFDSATGLEKFYNQLAKWAQDIDTSSKVNTPLMKVLAKITNGMMVICTGRAKGMELPERFKMFPIKASE